MSETGEQGMNPKDPAQRAGIGGGVVPDDKTEGEEGAKNKTANTADRSATPSANQPKPEAMPTSDHESAPSSGMVGSDDPQAPTK